MPYDGFGFGRGGGSRSLYIERRERACALWVTIPPARWNMRRYRNCALGWLGRRGHDGWRMEGEGLVAVPRWGGRDAAAARGDTPFDDAAAYFGLDVLDAVRVFGGREAGFKTAADVCESLIGRVPESAPPRSRMEALFAAVGAAAPWPWGVLVVVGCATAAVLF